MFTTIELYHFEDIVKATDPPGEDTSYACLSPHLPVVGESTGSHRPVEVVEILPRVAREVASLILYSGYLRGGALWTFSSVCCMRAFNLRHGSTVAATRL